MKNLPFFLNGQLFEPLTMVFIPEDENKRFALCEKETICRVSTLEPNLWVDTKENSEFKGFGMKIIDQ